MKRYFCYIQYFATGEGITYAMAFVYAKDESEAKKTFCRKHMCNEGFVKEEHIQDCITHFSHGVNVYDMSNESDTEKVKGRMGFYFTEKVIEHMFDANKAGALGEFYFKSYANYS